MEQDHDIHRYYNEGREQGRLTQAMGRLELLRTQEIILRYLPAAPQVVYDIGGGAGVYALWLARLGHSVHLIDMMPLHIEQAQAAAEEQPEAPLVSMRTGDARQLDVPDASADAVLLLGPLYHLQERDERLAALREAHRILKRGGLLFAATISRFASLMESLSMGYLLDAEYTTLLKKALVDGRHSNPSGQRGYFTTAYFHHPDEIQPEAEDAGFAVDAVLSVEGPALIAGEVERYWESDDLRERLLDVLRRVESDRSILGTTGHILTVAHKA